MPTFKLVIGTKGGKSVQKECPEDKAGALLGKRIGDAVSGDTLGFDGYEFTITGGSDNCGFPMRADVQGVMRQRILGVQGVGQHKKGNGIRYRKTVAGNTVHDKTIQVNLKVTKEGKTPLIEPAAAPAEGAPAASA